MKIVRNGKNYRLTKEEIWKAHCEFVIDWMTSTLISDFGTPKTKAKNLANIAFEKYCDGDGKTEYECLEWVNEKFKKGEI